ncbi:MAG: undecaprenyldiphospho-muramoylpentapeptide beta-N-acetylglucosaminyltransferase [Anaerohalosphaera sp.]|nr:undecaprenyldiphospho-muramoylpentapeptide beta-N-acetylglucosaminyltransferase [Anaerohalosphaera sp.]
MTKKNYFFAGGGTGGHIYPAIAVAQQLKQMEPDCEITFLCSNRLIDYYILSKTEFNFIPIPAKGLSVHPVRLVKFLYLLMYGKQMAVNILEKIADNSTVIGVGGFASAPVVLAAKKLKIPVVMINVDIVPGKANKFLARYASKIFVQFDETKKHFGGNSKKVEVVGCPLRSEFSNPDPDAAYRSLAIDRDKKILLVTGASSGAQNINDAMLTILGDLEKYAVDWQIVHLTGKANYESVNSGYADSSMNCKVIDYCDDMHNLYAASEIIIGRAGAVSIAEFAAAGKPVICLPYPYHKDKHQYLNAEQLVKHGAAVIVDDLPNDKAKTAKDLLIVLTDLMADEEKRNAMKQGAIKASKPNAAKTIATYISGI